MTNESRIVHYTTPPPYWKAVRKDWPVVSSYAYVARTTVKVYYYFDSARYLFSHDFTVEFKNLLTVRPTRAKYTRRRNTASPAATGADHNDQPA